MAYIHDLCRKRNLELLAKGDDTKEWYVNDNGQMRLRSRKPLQRRMDLGEKRP